MENKLQHHNEALHSYVWGFILSIALTIAAYVLVVSGVPQTISVMSVLFLAVGQLLVQLIFFLHLGKESQPKWNLIVFVFTLLILSIIVIGSLWIMHNLQHTSAQDMFVDGNVAPENQKN